MHHLFSCSYSYSYMCPVSDHYLAIWLSIAAVQHCLTGLIVLTWVFPEGSETEQNCIRDYVILAIFTVAGSRLFSVISQLLLTYFPSYFLNISHFPTISQLFLTYFSKISHFQTISGSHFSLLSYFSTISHLLLSHFSTISQLLLDYFPVTPRHVKHLEPRA